MALQVASIESGTASLAESPVFGKKDQGDVDMQRVAFAGFDDPAHKIPVLTDEPADAASYVPLIVTNSQNEPMAIWVEKGPFEVRFSNTPEELAVLKKSRTCHAEYVAAKVQNAIGVVLPTDELEWAIDAAELETDPALHKVSRQDAGLERAMIVGGNQQFYLLTRNKKLGDKILGTGHYKKVKYAVDLVTGDVDVVAVCRKSNMTAGWEEVEQEAEMMQELADVPNIVRLYAYLKTDEKIYFIMENCSGGDLSDAIFESQTALTEAEQLQIAQELSSGLAAIHAKNMLHRDLKPENIFLTKDKHVRFADFGHACLNSDLERRKCLKGTAVYASPELLHTHYDKGLSVADRQTATQAANIDKTDVWSMGIVLFQLFTRQDPWNMRNDPLAMIYVYLAKQSQIDKRIDKANLSPGLTEILKRMLQVDPAQRWTAQQVQKAMSEL